MGGQEVVARRTTPQDVIDYLNELCPQAMSLGMSLDEYWHGDPANINFYIKAEEHRQRKLNSQFWLQGAYVYYALCCASPMFNSLAKDHKPKKYLTEPFAMSKEEEDERQYEKFKQRMFGLAKQNKEGGNSNG